MAVGDLPVRPLLIEFRRDSDLSPGVALYDILGRDHGNRRMRYLRVFIREIPFRNNTKKLWDILEYKRDFLIIIIIIFLRL